MPFSITFFFCRFLAAAARPSQVRFVRLNLVWVGLVLGAAAELHAAPAGSGTGAIAGRAFNPSNGEYVERARISVDALGRETFTDNLGHYFIAGLPTGPVTVKAFRTGLAVSSAVVRVTAGQTVQHDFNLTGFARPSAAGDASVQQLSKFVVSESREMDGAAIAINEQRFASDIRNVITADEFGHTPEGNVGDLLKFVPGISINTGFGISRGISLNGVPDAYVPVTVNGFNLASPLEGTSRHVDPQNMSTNNASRIEVLYSPTPESPGMALAGSVNVVPRSAFERSKPLFNANAFVLVREDERDFNRTPGPGKKSTRKIHPGFNFSYVAPVNERFGFTLSGGTSRQYIDVEFGRFTWQGVGSATNGTTFPDTTADRPYLSQFTTQSSNSTDTSRYSLGATVDYKLGPHDRISLSFQFVYHTGDYNNRAIFFAAGAVPAGGFSPTFTRGTTGAGSVTLQTDAYYRTNLSYTPSIIYRHQGPIWRAEAGLGHSRGITAIDTGSRGAFFNTTARRTGVTVGFEDIATPRPRRITVTDGVTGAIVDPFNLDSYALVSGSIHTLDTNGSDMNKGSDLQRSAYANVGRDLSFGLVPVSLKAGLDMRQTVRDLKIGASTTYTYVGRDGRPSTTPAAGDDQAGFVLDASNSTRPGAFGLPPIQWVSNQKLWEHYETAPSYFTANEVAAHSSRVSNSKFAEETISSAYFRADVHLLERRLKLVGGLRAEQTNVKAEGPLNDLTRNYQRDASGRIVLGSNGRPLPITTDPLAAVRLTAVERAGKAEKEYLRLFPSLNMSFQIRENLIVRAAHYYSVGRPSFNQYAGGITLPDTESLTPSTQRITVQNAAIKAWEARSTRVALEYYFQNVGLISVGAYRRDIENFFGNTLLPATPEFLALYGLDPAIYGQYDVATQENVTSTVRMTGLDINYKQALTFLPHWARGLQVFANASSLRAIGPATANFSGFVPRTYNWGVSFSREKFNVKMNWNYRGRNRQGLVAAGRGIAPNTFTWGARQRYSVLSAEYRLSKSIGLYMELNSQIRNDNEIVGPDTPSYARLVNRQEYGGLWTFGVKGSF